jgi:1-acyl-sn-glycerol-3-phosphate acyltransferase
MRFLGLNAIIILHTLFFCFWALILTLLGSDSRSIHLYVAKPWARVILWLSNVKVDASGCENVDAGVPRVYMANHQSYFDILGLLAYLPVDFKFLMKQELMRIPIFGFTMRRAGYIGIERNDPRKAVKSIQEAAQRIRDGASVLIFPEGTRSVDGHLQDFKRGGFKLALKSRSDIVPVVIRGSRRILPKGRFRINRGRFSLSVGNPIAVNQYFARDVDALMARVREEILKGLESNPAS